MFSLFKRNKGPRILDNVWMSKQAKWNACRQMATAHAGCLFVVWFEATKKELEAMQLPVVLAHELLTQSITDKLIVFAEHYPLRKQETALFEKLALAEIPVLSSLDETLFMQFGGERTIQLMKQMGMKEDEQVSHSLITKSIHRAQQKLEEKVRTERLAHSQEEWFALNVRG